MDEANIGDEGASSKTLWGNGTQYEIELPTRVIMNCKTEDMNQTLALVNFFQVSHNTPFLQ